MKQKWWLERVAYQIYPKSFYDSSGDGIGDIRGIIEKLDYLKDLGIGILWLSPVYKSPLADQGYDISDYYDIDERFGTLSDMEELIAEADKRDIKIIMDLVVNHCSDEHIWFQKACEDPDGEYGKYFYIVDKKEEGLPTNWRSYFGGSVWDILPGHEDKYYLHMFHKKQPDLNWENPTLRKKVYEMINWWLEKGVAGFRVDAIINIKKPEFMDYPPDREDGMAGPSVVLSHAKGIGEFLLEMRKETFDKYQAFTVAEVFDADDLENYISEDGYFSSIFDFSTAMIGQSPLGWYDRQKPDMQTYIRTIYEAQDSMRDIGYFSNIIENHDEPRGVSHYLSEQSDAAKKALALTHILLRGIPFIYQGQEIGMENMDFSSLEEMDDVANMAEYELCMEKGYSKEESLSIIKKYSRDNARTPMQWNDAEYAGFSTHKPWLIVNPNVKEINVCKQMKDEKSVWHFYKKLICLRGDNPTLIHGDIEIYDVNPNVMGFVRRYDKVMLCLANLSPDVQAVKLPVKIKNILLNTSESLDLDIGENILRLQAYQSTVLELES